MRVLILAAAASFFITGSAMAAHHHHHHDRAASAPAAEGSVPADTLSAHDAYVRNLHDSGYNPAAAGN